jgi:hypothetical protein
MLASVISVKKQTREQFQTSIPQFKANVKKGGRAGSIYWSPSSKKGRQIRGTPTYTQRYARRGPQATSLSTL